MRTVDEDDLIELKIESNISIRNEKKPFWSKLAQELINPKL